MTRTRALEALVCAAAAAFILLSANSLANPQIVSATTAAELDRILGDCPGECSSFGCDEGTHFFTEEMDLRDQYYGTYHPFPDCQDKPCCWEDGKNGLHPPCGEPCGSGFELGQHLDVLSHAAEVGDSDALFDVLRDSELVTLNMDRSAIQLRMKCGDRYVGNVPVDDALAQALQQRLQQLRSN